MKRKPKKEVRLKIKQLTGNRCGYCGAYSNKLTIDHVKPLSRGGTNTQHNLIACCFDCNHCKDDLMPVDFKARIEACIRNPMREDFTGECWQNVRERFSSPVMFYYERYVNNMSPAAAAMTGMLNADTPMLTYTPRQTEYFSMAPIGWRGNQ